MPPRLAIAALLALGAAVSPAAASAEVIWAVGDGADAGTDDDALAARIAREGVDRFLYLGDVYDRGTASEFQSNYGSSFGRFFSASSPTPGNHEWDNRAAGYDPYWGQRAPQTAGGHYYAFDFGGWHFVSLNSQEDTGPGSRQVEWLRQDLAANPGTCTIAFWHRPRYSAGSYRNVRHVEPFWDALRGHATIVVNGHDHNMQRFAPRRGMTQFVAGAGGRRRYPVDESHPGVAYANDAEWGALRLELARGVARWAFVSHRARVLDSGTIRCVPRSP